MLDAMFRNLRSFNIVKPSFRENASGHEICIIMHAQYLMETYIYIVKRVTMSAYYSISYTDKFRVSLVIPPYHVSYHPILIFACRPSTRRKFDRFRSPFLGREKKKNALSSPLSSIRDVLSVIMKEILLFKGSPRGMSSTARNCHQ